MKERPILFTAESVRAILAGTKTQTRRAVKMERLVQPRKMVRGDAPFASNYCADPRWIYDAEINQHGAVSAKVSTGADGDGFIGLKPGEFDFKCPYADGETVLVSGEGWRIIPTAGERLWVKETWALTKYKPQWTAYRATSEMRSRGGKFEKFQVFDGPWKGPRFMPRAASRLTLEITRVRVERVQDISDADARAEGMEPAEFKGTLNGAPSTGMIFDPRLVYRYAWDAINGKRDFGWDKNPWVWVIEFRRVP